MSHLRILCYFIISLSPASFVLCDTKVVCFDGSDPCHRQEKLQCSEGSTIHIKEILGWFRPSSCSNTCEKSPNTGCCRHDRGDVHLGQRNSDSSIITEQCSAQTKCFPFDGLPRWNDSGTEQVYIVVNFDCQGNTSESVNIVVIVVPIFLLVVGIGLVAIILYFTKRRDDLSVNKSKETEVNESFGKESTCEKDKSNRSAQSSKLFSVVYEDGDVGDQAKKSRLKYSFKREIKLINEDFDKVNYSKGRLAEPDGSHKHRHFSKCELSDTTLANQRSKLANTLSCLGIEVINKHQPTSRRKSRNARRCKSMLSSDERNRQVSRTSTIAQTDSRYKESYTKYRKQRTDGNISILKTELLDDDFDDIQYSKCFSDSPSVPPQRSKTYVDSESNRNLAGRDSHLAATLSCMGIEVNERRHTRRTKSNLKGTKAEAYVNRPSDNDADERSTSSRSDILKTVIVPDTANVQEKSTPSQQTDRFTKTRAMSKAYERQYYYNISDYVQAEKKLMIRKTPHRPKAHNDTLGKGSNTLPSKTVNNADALIKDIHDANTPRKTREKDNVSQVVLTKSKRTSAERNHHATKTKLDAYTSDNAISINELPHNKHLTDTQSFPCSGLQQLKQPAFREEARLSDSEELSARDKSPSTDGFQSLTPQDTHDNLDKQRDKSLRRSVSSPTDYAFPNKSKLSVENRDSGNNKDEEKQKPVVKEAAVAADIKHKRKRKHTTVWLHQPTEAKHDFSQMLVHDNTTNRMTSSQSLPSKDVIGQQTSVPLDLKPGCERDVSNDNSKSEIIPRPGIEKAKSKLANEAPQTGKYHPMSNSKALSEGIYKPTDKETSSIQNDNLYAETRKESGPANDKNSDISGPAMDDECVNQKTVKTAVVRPIIKEERKCKRSVQRSASFSCPHNQLQLKRLGVEGASNASVYSHDSRLSRKLRRAASDTHGRTAIRKKGSMEIPSYIPMHAVLNSNNLNTTYPNGLKSLMQSTNKSLTDGTIKFHSERKPSFKFSNIADNAEDAHKSKAMLFSRGMNDENDTQDLNDVIENCDDGDSMAHTTDSFAPEVQKTVTNGGPYRSASFLIQSTAEKSRSVQRSKSDRHVQTNNSKL